MKTALLFSCEHGGNRVPREYARAFGGATDALESHRGLDIGALVLARELARAFGAPLFECRATRLLVDANRSLGHPRLFSEWSRRLPPSEREAILARFWRPHREAVEAFARERLAAGERVLHLSIHSFTPIWKGRERDVDVGWLFDPARPRERAFVGDWLAALRERRPDLRLRRNRPYFGDTDGLTTTLRGELGESLYFGLELEVSQRFPQGTAAPWRRLRRELLDALRDALRPDRMALWQA